MLLTPDQTREKFESQLTKECKRPEAITGRAVVIEFRRALVFREGIRGSADSAKHALQGRAVMVSKP